MTSSPDATLSIKNGFIILNWNLACDNRWRILRALLQRRGELTGGKLRSAATTHSRLDQQQRRIHQRRAPDLEPIWANSFVRVVERPAIPAN
jgi:hypothetical protein